MTGLLRFRHPLVFIVLLSVVTAGLYWPMLDHSFISIDDHEYISDNPEVVSGLTLRNVRWALTTGHASNWHPVTWISHMLDCQLFGVRPGGHHFVNLLFHVVNTVLLFLLLRQLTGANFRSALVAALFAWHPLHVESVAWASERKDVLCAFFWFLATMAYAQYTRQGKAKSYWIALLLYALGLMSKPMLVTFPFVLLLLDYWPLQRLRLDSIFRPDDGANGGRSLAALVREKLPFFGLALISSVVTYLVQSRGGAVSSLQAVSPLLRLENAAVSYARYVLKTLWPSKLAAIYPYPDSWPTLQVLGALALLALVTFWAWRKMRTQPYLLIGWLWFLGTLVPTIGLVQVGSQSMADRYTYVPAIGLFLTLVWWAHQVLPPNRPAVLRAAFVAAAGLLGLLALATRFQLGTWRNSETLYRHAMAVTKDNYIALDGLGSALDVAGRSEEARKLFEESVRIEPRYPPAQYDLGTVLLGKGEYDQAISRFRNALRDNPKFAMAHSNLGLAFLRQGNLLEAEQCFLRARELQPRNAEAYYNVATVYIGQARLGEAITNLLAAIRFKPDFAAAHGNLGVTLMRVGNSELGIRHLETAARLEPQNPEAHFNLGLARLDTGKALEAEPHFLRALALKPGDAQFLCKLAVALSAQKKYPDAVARYREALGLNADAPEALQGLAWIRCTSTDAAVRDAGEAVRLAERANEVTGQSVPLALLTLAAAYAEAGRFPEAIAAVQKAQPLAAAAQQTAIVGKAATLLEQFARREPYRE